MANSAGDKSNTCGICLNTFDQPKLLPCFHTFCRGCLDTFVSNSPDTGLFHCPTCRYEVTLPEGGVKKFQNNFYIIARAEKDGQEDDICCDVCDNTPTQLCYECDFLLCDSCVKHHIDLPQNALCERSHTLISLDEQSKGKLVVSREEFCEKHAREKLRFYCKPCDKVMCLLCIVPYHKGHPYENICDAALTARVSLDKTKVKLEKHLPEMVRSSQLIKNRRGHCVSLLDTVSVSGEIHKTADELLDRINSIRNDAIQKLKTEKSITEAVDVMQVQQQFLHRQIDHIKELLREGHDFDLIAADREMKQRLKVVENMDFSITSNNPLFVVTSSQQRFDRLGCDVNDTITGLVSQIRGFQEEMSVLSQFSCGNGKIRTIDLINSKDALIVSANHRDPGDEIEYFINECTRLFVKMRVRIPPNSFDNDDVITIGEAIEANDSEWDFKTEEFTDNSSSSNPANTSDSEKASDPVKLSDPDKSSDPDDTKDLHRDLKVFKRKYLYCGFSSNRDKCWVDRDNDWVIVKPISGVARILDFNPFAKPGKMFKPLDVCWGKLGKIYIVDGGSEVILVYNVEEGFEKSLTIPGDSFLPSAVAMDKDGQLWIGQMNGNVSVCNLA